MATTLPGSPYVESSDLVAGYPGVSETLAERVDTVGILPFADSTARGTALPSPTEGQYSYLQDTNATEYWDGSAWSPVAGGALKYVGGGALTGSSVSFDNVFTATYDNYLILVRVVPSAATTFNNLKLRVGGVDSSANYNNQWIQASSTSVTGTRVSSANDITAIVGSGGNRNSYEMMSPAIAESTFINLVNNSTRTSPIETQLTSTAHTVSTAYDGFTLSVPSGTFTGTVKIYGYANS